jgi:hypothetical protein
MSRQVLRWGNGGSLRSRSLWLFVALVVVALAATPALADDGPMLRKSVAKTPAFESEHAQLSMMQFYVPATAADGTLVPIDYFADRDGDNRPDELLFTRAYAKPLVVTYWDEEPTGAAAYDISTGDEVGPAIRRDVWAAISLDDGNTWKQRNLSESAVESSFDLANGIAYPGDVTEQAHMVAGNQILVAWTSKYCAQGSPRYSVKDDLDADGDGDSEEALYPDLFGVAGNQRSIDYTEWRHHGSYPFAHIGEIPFSCVWTARGTIEYLPAGDGSGVSGEVWGVRWRKPERLTSGRRDAYKLAIDGVEGAGFVVAWQEDPEGLRPGYGEGPGVGWSGATVNHKADIWYTFIGWNDFVLVEDPATPGVPAVDPDLLGTNKPQVFERMAMPVRLTDNEKCELVAGQPKTNDEGEITMPWCYDLDVGDGTPAGKGTPDGVGDLCPVSRNAEGVYTVVDPTRIVAWTNSRGITMDICISDDGRMLNGQTGSSRPRLMMEGYTRRDGTKSAWVALMYEESKGLGAGHGDEPALDIGKDAMYHSFDMFNPDLVADGHMLNMPQTADEELAALYGVAVGDFLPLLTNDLAVAMGLAANQYDTSIGRRGSLMLQPAARMVEEGYRSGMTTAVLLYKSGADRQGGPADIFMRRIVLPRGFDRSTDNPFAVENLVCDELDASLSDGDYPTYPRTSYPYGLCVRGARNLSSTIPLTFEALGNEDRDPSHGIYDRVLTWTQTPENVFDEDWTNGYEVAKGHRGFLDGDFVMVMYGWSPNWLATSKGHEPYNLYIRRSFDGGVTWTTTPAGYGGDGTSYEQVNGVGDRVWTELRSFAAGEFEPARNVSQITSSKETILDPRYSPTNIGTQTDVSRILLSDGSYQTLSTSDPLYDLRDPSKFFAVYETGDASVVLTAGEADPWDLFASRATEWGDTWDTYDHYVASSGLYEERWDWVENKDEDRSGESSIAASPDGQFAWIVWNQWTQHETDLNGDGFEDVTASDPMFRRLWWDDAVLVALAGTYTAAAGELVTLVGDAVYDGFETLLYTWDLDNDGTFETEGREVTFPATGSAQAVALKVCEDGGRCDIGQGWVNPGPHAPRVWRIRGETTPAMVGTTIAFTGRFNAPGTPEAAELVWTWGDGSSEPADLPAELQGQGASFAAGSHAFTAAGVYAVTLTVTDSEGRTGFDTEYFAVYDPAAGRITGEAEIVANGHTFAFALDAQYDKKSVLLKGQAVVTVDAGEAVFRTTGLDWLAVEPDGMSHLRASGTLNGKGGYALLITLFDGGHPRADLARVRIWHGGAGKNGHLVYDSQPSTPIGGSAATPLSEGNVTLHLK